MNRILSILVICFLTHNMHAQSSISKEDKIIIKADQILASKNAKSALNYLQKKIGGVKDKAIIYLKMGNIATQEKDYAKATEYFRSANSIKNQGLYSIQLAESLYLQGKYSEARAIFFTIMPQNNWLAAKREYYERIKALVNTKMITQNDSTIIAKNIGEWVNTKEDEYFPSVAPNDSVLIYTSKYNGVEEDFYQALKDTCEDIWMYVNNMGYPPNSAKNESAQAISYDRHYMVFMRCGINSDNGWTGGGCDLYFTYTNGDKWNTPLPFGATINTPYFEGMPSFSSDNMTLYFVSDREGGYGGLDIWKSDFKNKGWQLPENLGPEINTALDDYAPFIAADNKTLFFTSKGHGGMGGSDLFMSRWMDGKWTTTTNLGAPYNSKYDEMSAIVTVNGQKIYWSSNRPDGYGGKDIYEAKLSIALQPEQMDFFYGYIVDTIKGKTITDATIEIYESDNSGEQLIHSLKSNKGDGSFFITLPIDKTYTLKAKRWDYPEKEFQITTTNPQQYPPNKLELHLDFWQ